MQLVTAQQTHDWPRLWPLVRRYSPLAITLGVFAVFFATVLLSRPVTFSPDEAYYMVIGRNIIAGVGPLDEAGELAAEHPPLFSLLLALLFGVLPATIETAVLLPKAAACINVVLVYAIGRQLRDRRTGILAAVFAAASLYMIRFAGRILLDNLLATFMLASLLTVIVAERKQQWRWFALAGALLGCALLVKEIALLWFLLPVILLLVTDNRSIPKLIAAYVGGFGGVVIWWWLYFYAATGEIYLIHAPNRDFTLIIWLFAGMALTLIAAAVLLVVGLRRQQPTLMRILARLLNVSAPIKLAGGLLLLVAAWLGLAVMLVKIGAPVGGLAGIADRLQATVHYMAGEWFKLETWQIIAGGGWLLLLIRAVQRREPAETAVALGALLYLPLFFAISVPTTNAFPARQFQTLLWLSYAAAAYLIVAAIDYLVRLGLRLLRAVGVEQAQDRYMRGSQATVWGIVVAVVIAGTVQQNMTFLAANRQFDFLLSSSMMNRSTLGVADWLLAHSAQADTLYLSRSVARELAWATDGRFDTKPIQSGFRLDWYRDWITDTKDSRKYVFDPGTIDTEAADLLYIEPYTLGYRSPRYFALPAAELEFAQQQNGSYLVAALSGPNLRSNFRELPGFFVDHPSFDHLYRALWAGRTIDLFAVDGATLHWEMLRDYPLSIAEETVQWWRENNGDEEAAPAILALIDHLARKPFVILGSTEHKPDLYRFLAETLLQLGKPNLAAFAYQQMLQLDPSRAGELDRISSQLIDQASAEGGVWALRGDVALALGRLEEARAAYRQAPVAANPLPEATAAAYLGLAKLSLLDNDLAGAESLLVQANNASLFGAAKARYLMALLEAYVNYNSGQEEGARASLQQAIRTLPQQAVSDFLSATWLSTPAPVYTAGDDFDRFFEQTLSATLAGYQPLLATILEDQQPWLARGEDNNLPLHLLAQVHAELQAPSADSSAYLELAAIYSRLGQYDEAYAIYNDLAQQQPQEARFWNLLGQTAEQMGDTALAISAYKQALSRDSSLTATATRLLELALATNNLDETALWLHELERKTALPAASKVELGKALLQQVMP